MSKRRITIILLALGLCGGLVILWNRPYATRWRVHGVRWTADGNVAERILWKEVTYRHLVPISPEGPSWYDTVDDFYFLEANGKRKELPFMRNPDSSPTPNELWGHFFIPVANTNLWYVWTVPFRSPIFKCVRMGLISPDSLIRIRDLPIVTKKEQLLKFVTGVDEDHLNHLDKDDLGDCHLFDGNRKIFYRNYDDGVSYHVYDVLQDRDRVLDNAELEQVRKRSDLQKMTIDFFMKVYKSDPTNFPYRMYL